MDWLWYPKESRQATIIHYRKQWVLSLSSAKSNPSSKSKAPSDGMKCTHCGNAKHTGETCFKLHGYPDWWHDLQVLRKVGKLDSTKLLWEKLEELYLVKSLPNKLFLLEKFFSFKIDSSKDLDDNLDIFNKLVQDIINTCEKVSEEYKAVILLNAIPEAYRDVKNAIKYGRDTLTQDIVINSLRSKDMELKIEKADSSNSESLYVSGRSQTRQNGSYEGQSSQGSGNSNYKKKNRGKSRSRSKSKSRNKKCYGCGKTGHFIKDCHKRKNDLKEKLVDEGNVVEPMEPNTVNVYVVTEPVSDHIAANIADHRD
ncbi:CCHC-type domain-containing protein [Abeliophyllum distichum]|uniref:CCHC-type domain-containing protein n=1 Tax=Abeliophyllum distichum TaxID=126358 RepID=A0ABD1TJC1_9LAMI